MRERLADNEIFMALVREVDYYFLALLATAIFFSIVIVYFFYKSRHYQKETASSAAKEPEKTTELDDIMQKMQQTQEEKEAEPENFEDEQEEEAIISYQELVNKHKKDNLNAVECQKEVSDFLKKVNKEEPNSNTKQGSFDFIDEGDLELAEKKKFKNSEVISPIYGRVQPFEDSAVSIKKEEKRDLEQEINSLSEKGENLLRNLKEFREKLD